MTERAAASPNTVIDIMLVSHTNAGKTTLVRTLLGQDVGEVLDAPDVTQAIAAHDLVADAGLGAVRLWDTPGFGDSFRLAQRLRQQRRWLAWLVRELWDRYRNPRLWRAQHVAIDLRQRASVILYLVNTLERPVDAIYIAPELEVLEWVGKPVLAILNQSGAAGPDEAEPSRIVQWREALAGQPCLRKVLGLDSYTRCWLQELVLYDEIGQVLDEASRHDYLKLAHLVRADHYRRFDESIAAIADYLLNVAGDRVELDPRRFGPLQDLWGQLRKKISWGDAAELQPHEQAMETLAQRFMDQTKAVTDRLIAINRLTGVSAGEIVETAGESFSRDEPVDASTSALAGGVISGALTGLGHDLLLGGVTLGTGALVGGVLGALGAAALAKGYNIYTAKGKKVVGWSQASMTEALAKSVMLYLAIAHFGRGQGEWRRTQHPGHWGERVASAIARDRERLPQLWARCATGGEIRQTQDECATVLRHVLVEVLGGLYPQAADSLLLPASPARAAANEPRSDGDG